MKAVKNLFLMFALVFAASSSYAQEVKPVKCKPEINKEVKKRNNPPAKQVKPRKVQTDLQQSKLKPVRIESRVYKVSN
jgi:hypothetical protein